MGMRHQPANHHPHAHRHEAATRVLPWVVLIGTFLLLSFAAALRAENWTAKATKTASFSASGTIKSLSLENVNGEVSVTAGPSFTAAVEITVKAQGDKQAHDLLDKTKVSFDNDNGELTLSLEEPGTHVTRRGKHGWSVHSDHDHVSVEARYQITLPASAALDLQLVNASITVKGITGELDLSTVNGRLDVTGARQSALLKTVNGTVDATFTELPKGASIETDTVNGNVVLHLPAKSGFKFSAHTMSGDIVATFPLPAGAQGDEDRKARDEARRERDKMKAERDRIRREIREKEKERKDRSKKEDRDTIEIRRAGVTSAL